CRGGVPISGDAMGITEERRLVGRESEKDPGGSRVIALRLNVTGDSFRGDWNAGAGGMICSRHLARSSSSFCVHVASYALFWLVKSFCDAVRSSEAFWSFCSSFCVSRVRSSSLLSRSSAASLAFSSSSSAFLALRFYRQIST